MIGVMSHSLGMRHDGPLAENECDPSSFIMSPTLGSGKITWSSCSRRYLESFLDSLMASLVLTDSSQLTSDGFEKLPDQIMYLYAEPYDLQKHVTSQSQCLMDYTNSEEQLDHSSGGILPGERFNSDQQCMLKYGRGSVHASQQPLGDVCRDLHCQRERYTWTSHPALEGTACGVHKWCRSGRCVGRGLSALQAGFSPDQRVDGIWSDWTAFSDCASGCLLSDAGLVQGGSSGIMVSTRRCNNPRPENGGKTCGGSDRRFRTCNAAQCSNVQRTTIRDFADQICTRAREVDTDLLGTGLQRISSDRDTSEVSTLIVSTSEVSALIVSMSEMSALIVSTSEVSTLIVSTSEMSALIVSTSEMSALIVSTSEMSALFVSTSEMSALFVSTSEVSALKRRRLARFGATRGTGAPRAVAGRSRTAPLVRAERLDTGRQCSASVDVARSLCVTGTGTRRPCSAARVPAWTGGRLFVRTKGRRREVTDRKRSWNPASGCHFNCLAPASGLRLVKSPGPCDLEGDVQCSVSSLQLCQPDNQGCGHLKTPFEHASGVCDKYKERVSRLSGLGMQISPTAGEPKRSPSEQGTATLNLTYALLRLAPRTMRPLERVFQITDAVRNVSEDPDRPCRVACQDDEVIHRFYLVNGEDGWFPFGTDCSRGASDRKAYCISGKCLEFGADDTPLYESDHTLPLMSRLKRSMFYNSTRVVSTLDQATLNQIIHNLNLSTTLGHIPDKRKSNGFTIDLTHPVHEQISVEDMIHDNTWWER
uniref:Peptidase M12B domain-containing protein n=1 Tax=Timema cristinae TaxID=61476 RepID=A0A7R9CSB4_TIMCR|nr:unnamed protein product [Timema cristinae]